jgi:hypothetical protein
MSDTTEAPAGVISDAALRQLRATVRGTPAGAAAEAGVLAGGVAREGDGTQPSAEAAAALPAMPPDLPPVPGEDFAAAPDPARDEPPEAPRSAAPGSGPGITPLAVAATRGHGTLPPDLPAAPAMTIAAAPPDAAQPADSAAASVAAAPSPEGDPAGASLALAEAEGAADAALPPPPESGEASDSVIAATQAGDDTARTTPPAIRAVADAPAARAGDGAGDEDSAIALDLTAALLDLDGSETLRLAILGVPDGAALSAGSRQPDGNWLVAPDELAGLTLTPPPDFAGEIALTLRATATEAASGDTAVTERAFTVTVAPRVEADAALTAGGSGAEDGWIAIAARFATTDADGSEALAAVASIGGVPPGATLSHGTMTSPGLWSVPTADLLAGRVALRPPADSDATIRLSITATVEDSAGAARDSRTLTTTADIVVAAVADAPSARAGDAAGDEDSAIALDLTAALLDLDGSETLRLAILGVPDGAALSAGSRQPDGSWLLAPGELAGLLLTPPPDFAGEIALTLRATATEAANGDTAVTERAFTVRVGAVMDGAALSGAADGAEDGAIALAVAFGASPDASEEWAATAIIRGVPAGAMLSAGADLGGGTWQVDRAALAEGRIAITPPADSDADMTLTVEAQITDREGGGATRLVTAPLTVSVAAVADAPAVRAGDAAGDEDSAIALDLAAALLDLDGSETLRLAILGVPDGAALSAGSRQPDGSWLVAPDALAGLTLTPPPDFAGEIALTIRATATEAANGDTAVTERGFTVQVAGRADAATIVATATGSEDAWIPIRGSIASGDADGSETLSGMLTIGGVPPGAALSHGAPISPGVWSVPRAAFDAGVLAILPPANADADIALSIAVTSHDGDSSAAATAPVTVIVRAVADAPTVQVADARGTEDSAIRLAGLGGALTDTDGSEALSFVLSGVPATARLSAGVNNGDGSWTLTPAQLATVSITPPAHFSGTMNLTLTAVATEARDAAPPARSSARFVVGVDPVADAGRIAGSVTGDEDSAIVIRPGFSTPDGDGSETWSATTRISGVPAGATLSAGTALGGGAWDVATADLRAGRIRLTPPANSDADFTLTMRATLNDTGKGLTASRDITGTHRVTVRAVADAPVVTARNVAGSEDTPIPLGLAAALTDTDGSERFTLLLSGVPAGATLSAGTRNADGTWSVPPANLAALAMTPPRDFSGSIRLTLTATARDNDSRTATTTRSFDVRVDAVADAPGLRVGPAIGNEDSAIALRVSGWTTDADGSERLVGFRLLDVPGGAVVRAGGAELAREADGSVVVAAAAAPTLAITPPPHGDADFTLRVAAIAAEPNGSTAESPPRDLPVRVEAVADAPVWLRLGADGLEDTPIPLDLAARMPDADGSERLSFVVSGLPAGAVLSAGTYRGPGTWSLTAAEAAAATILPPRDFAGTIDLTVSAVTQEANGGHQAASTVSFPIRVAAVLDTGDWSRAAHGAEDAPIALNLSPPLRDSDGSERLVGTLAIEGVPAGAVLRLGDGSVVSQGLDGTWRIAADRLAGVTLTMPADSDVAARLTVRATIEDTGGQRGEVTGTLTVDPRGVADMPSLAVTGVTITGHAETGGGAGWAALPIAAAVADTDGSESLHLWVRDLPAGFALSAGTPAGDGAWLLRADDLAGLAVRPPAGFAGDVTLRVQAVSVEREGDTEASATTLLLHVEAPPPGAGGDGGATAAVTVAQAPSLAVAADPAMEDSAGRLHITAASSDHDGGSETLGIRIAGLPAGARLTAGIHDPEHDVWVLRPAELAELAVVPPADFAGSIALNVTAIAVERTGSVASTGRSVSVAFAAVADGAAIAAAPAAGSEDAAVPLNLGIAARDSDGSETITAITIAGLPAGAAIAPGTGITDNGDGTWSVLPEAAGNVRFVPPPQAHGSFALTVAATTREASNGATATVSRGVTVSVAAVPDAPSAAAADAAGFEDRPLALGLSAALRDSDGSEALSLVIGGLPEGARLSAGINNGDGTWTLTPSQLAGLTLTPPGNWSGTMALTMDAHAMERSTGAVATTRTGFTVTVAGVADLPLADAPATAAGREDQAVSLDIVARLTDTDGSETLALHVTGVPSGAVFSAGAANPDGSWTIPGGALPGLTFTPPPDYAGTLRLDFAATTREADGDSAVAAFRIAVTVDPVADAPVLALAALTGTEDTALRLPLAATLTDADGSEAIDRFIVTGLPAGATLSAGTRTGTTWTLTAAQAETATLIPPANFAGSFTLGVTAISREAANGSEASSTATLPVTIAAVADAPVLGAANAAGTEDRSVPLTLSVALADADGSESITAILLTGLPDAFALSAGTRLPGGEWSLLPRDLAGLRLNAPADWHGTLSLGLQASVQDGASSASAARAFTVTVAAVNDAPVLALSPAQGAASGQLRAAILDGASVTDVDDASMGGATIALTGEPGDRLVFAGFALRDEGGRTLLGDTGIAVTTAADGTVTLAGAAPIATYQAVLGSLALENAGGLEAGTRGIAITLRDQGGAAAATQVVALPVVPSHIAGGEASAALAGTAGHDTFTGGSGNETMTGGAGADLFILAMDGSADSLIGGDGPWTDAIRVEGAGAPGTGNWTLVLDGGTTAVAGDTSFDFAQPASGQILFADGSQIGFQEIERITW